MRKIISAMVTSSFLLMGCASSPDNIQAAYVSPLEYQSYSCNQIREELRRVSRRVHEISGQQQKEADGDAVALGVGLVLFWPALFFMMGDDQEEALARLKGEYDALEQAAIKKNCSIAAEIEEARKLAEERQEKKEIQRKEVNG